MVSRHPVRGAVLLRCPICRSLVEIEPGNEIRHLTFAEAVANYPQIAETQGPDTPAAA